MDQDETIVTNYQQNISNKIIYSGNSIDICFLLDITKSMQDYIEMVKNQIGDLLDKLSITKKEIRLGFVGYRDMKVENPDEEQFEWLDFNFYKSQGIEQSEIYLKLKQIQCSGGGDFAEDVRGAIKYAIKQLNWQAGQKFLILITDAPAHGIKYNYGCKDNHPDEILEDSLQLLIENNIELALYEFTEYTQEMASQMEEFYQQKMYSSMFSKERIMEKNLNELAIKLTKSIEETINQKLKI